MTDIALILFAAAAVGGLIMATKIMRGSTAPWPLSIAHAALGAGGLVLLLLPVVAGTGEHLVIPLVILVIAALGGFFLASFHARKKPSPRAIIAIHAGVAVLGVLALVNVLYL